MKLLIEILFEILKRCLKASLCVALLSDVARGADLTPTKRRDTRLQFCLNMQRASLLGDWEDCIEVLNNAGLLEQTRAELIEDGVDPKEIPDDVK